MTTKTTTEHDEPKNEIEKALEIGIRNTHRADAANAELHRSTKEFAAGIRKWSGGLVDAALVWAKRPKRTPKMFYTALLGGLYDEYEQKLAVEAKISSGATEILCWVETAARGYPIDVSYADVQHRVTEPHGILDTFKQMLTHPAVARPLMELRTKAAETTAAATKAAATPKVTPKATATPATKAAEPLIASKATPVPAPTNAKKSSASRAKPTKAGAKKSASPAKKTTPSKKTTAMSRKTTRN